MQIFYSLFGSKLDFSLVFLAFLWLHRTGEVERRKMEMVSKISTFRKVGSMISSEFCLSNFNH